MAKSVFRSLGLRLAASTGTVAAGLGWMSAEAQAACQLILAAPPFFLCDGVNTTPQAVVTGGTADVRTASGFQVDTTGAGGNALTISSDGPVIYTDPFASPLTSPDTALRLESSGDSGLGPGSITVDTGGAITGGTGILAENNGSGSVDITATGPILATDGVGIHIINHPSGENISVLSGDVAATGTAAGDAGIYVQNVGTGTTRIESAGAVSAAVTGIRVTGGTNTTGMTVVANGVSGGNIGISVYNQGGGQTGITATGAVSGTAQQGIYAYVDSNGTGLTIEAAAVSGGTAGIEARNNGTGLTEVKAGGRVTSATREGIAVVNGAGAGALTVEAADVEGATYGIYALNEGSGATSVTSTGSATGVGNRGIRAFNQSTATDITVSAVNAAGTAGISARNFGTGATRVTATGTVTGTLDYGIFAENGASAGDLILDVADVFATTGSAIGVQALNAGTGATSVTASGRVAGARIGIAAETATGTDVTVEAVDVSGQLYGIFAQNGGSGAIRVRATGDVVSGAGGDGIFANAYGSANGIDIQAFDARGDLSGIRTRNQGPGETRIAVTGEAVSANGSGIAAYNGLAGTAITITAESARGGSYGIWAVNEGTGATSITTGGLVEGGIAAISVDAAGKPIVITTGGLVRNLSQLSSDLAVETADGPVLLTNAGGMIGTVRFGAGGHVMINDAAWNPAGGASEFGGGTLTNHAAGMIVGAADGGALETTMFNGLAGFISHGLLDMADGGAGDTTRQAGGDAQFEAGSSLAVDVDAAGAADSFVTTGAATLSGATLAVNPVDGFAYGARYTVLTADGGLSGTFAGLAGRTSTAFLRVEDSYDSRNAYLDVVRYRRFADAGLTPNQTATGEGLDSIPPAGPLFDAVIGLATDAQARDAFDRLSGEIHASAKNALIEDSRLVRDAATDRIRSAFAAAAAPSLPVMAYGEDEAASAIAAADRLAIWGRGLGAWGKVDGDGNAAALHYLTGGLLIGADAPVSGNWRLGAVAGYSHTGLSARDRASSGSSQNYHFGLYGGARFGDLGLRGGIAYTRHDISTARTAAFAGFSDSLTARYGADTLQAFGEVGYGFGMARATLEPFAGLAHVHLRTGAFTERGGAAALRVDGQSTGSTFATLGLRASADLHLGAVKATARGMLGWRHAFGSAAPLSHHAFAGGSAFAIAGVPVARDAAILEAGMDFRLTPAATLGLSYNGELAAAAQRHALRADLAIRF